MSHDGSGRSDADPDALVRQFIEGDLSSGDLQPALHRIADDPDARELLQFEVAALPALARPPRSVPDSFADDTLSAIAAAEADSSAEATSQTGTTSSPASPAEDDRALSITDRLRSLWDAWTAPQPVRVRPLTGVAVLLAVVAGAWLLRPGAPTGPSATAPSATDLTASSSRSADDPASSARASMQRTASDARLQQGDVVWMRFVYTADDADSVAVAGDFSDWEPIPLSPRTVNEQTVWTGLVPVSRGEHEYQFVINGTTWVTDPLAPVKRDDGFGAENAVLKL